MNKHNNLPVAEFEVMQIIWDNPVPISTVLVHSLAKPEKKWKLQSVMTLLTRLEKRGFLSSEKRGRERFYIPLVTQEDYLNRETSLFIKRYHKNSLTRLMGALFAGGKPKGEDLSEIEAWLKAQQPED
ncbi:MAG: BlaI/MecI/CopY family transcriptional regulator [Defluviitaleaceae bacterium]|nr:BlaI/MecI/CopY family transcriptional regulator [Defluviitaleaceae bacterium]